MIYLASSWKNAHHTQALEQLRAWGQNVYDFKNPAEGIGGFGWRQITDTPKPWPLDALDEVLKDRIAQTGFAHDFRAMQECRACVLLLPSGKSAHLEAGWFVGMGRPVVVWGFPGDLHEPELMYLMTNGVATSIADVVDRLCTASPHFGRIAR